MEDRITLDELPLGKDGIIDSVECEDVALRYHILDMGLVPNVEVTLIKMHQWVTRLKLWFADII